MPGAAARTAIAISGDLGSGKSSVGKALAARLDWRYVSTGEIQRSLASQRSMSTLEVNHLAEVDASIDVLIDDETKRLGVDGTPTVFDSRMAWHFVPTAFKVHLVVAPDVGAERMFGRTDAVAESYTDKVTAMADAAARAKSERHRFSTKYGVDVWRLRNYDLVVDSSDATIEEVTEAILDALAQDVPAALLRIAPRHVIPIGEDDGGATRDDVAQPAVCYSRPYVFAIRDLDLLSRDIRAGRTLVPAHLDAEGADPLDGSTADEYLFENADLDRIRAWEAEHGIPPGVYPTLESD